MGIYVLHSASAGGDEVGPEFFLWCLTAVEWLSSYKVSVILCCPLLGSLAGESRFFMELFKILYPLAFWVAGFSSTQSRVHEANRNLGKVPLCLPQVARPRAGLPSVQLPVF